MKRRFKSGTEYPITIAPGDTAQNHGSDKPFEMRKVKRGRFVNAETDGLPIHASLGGHEATQSPRSAGAPKTSEYAYFRKVKDGAVHGNSRSRSLHKEDEQSKSSKLNYLIRETVSAFDLPKPSTEDFRFAVSGERARPSDHHLFLSPHVGKCDEAEQMRSKELTNKIDKRSSLLSKNITPVGKSLSSPPLDEALQNSDNQCIEEGIFSAKRHRLRQWAVQTSEAGKPHPERFDLVSSLLSRLFPKGNENNDSSKEDKDNSSKSPKSDNLDKGLHLSRKRDWDKNQPKICSGRSSEIVLSELETSVSRLPFPSCGTESHAPDEPMDLDQRSKSHITRTFPTKHDFSFCLPFERYRSSGSFHFKELDEFDSVIEHAREEAPNRLLLEWDSEGRKDRIDSSFFNPDTAKNVYPRLGTSWNFDQHRIVDNMVNSRGLYPTSLSSNYYLEFNSLPNYGSTSYLTQDFGPYFYDMKYAMAEPRQFSLALPYTLAEDKNAENMHCDSNIVFCYGDQFKNKVWEDKPQSHIWWKLLSATDDSLSNFHAWQSPKKSSYSFSEVEEDPGEPFTPFSKGTFNNHFSSSNFPSSLDTSINPPLLLDHVSHNRFKQEYFDNDNDDNDLLYG